jgi:tRNA pseudouridine32 synthase/23S rRNA pseudouridine746 synthase
VVDYENGKRAVTRYRVDKVEDGKTWITLFPETGRTHQLRVHCAHQDGLNCPILGDPIYGRNGNEQEERMYLHAERLELTHPTTGKRIVFIVKSEEWRVKGGGENAR